MPGRRRRPCASRGCLVARKSLSITARLCSRRHYPDSRARRRSDGGTARLWSINRMEIAGWHFPVISKLLAPRPRRHAAERENQVSPRDATVRAPRTRRTFCTGRNARGVRSATSCSRRPTGSSLERCGPYSGRRMRAAVFQQSEPDALREISLCEEFETRPPACIPRSRCTTAAHSARSCAIWSRGGQIVTNERDDGYFYLDSHEKWLKALESETLPFTKRPYSIPRTIFSGDLLVSCLKHMGS